MSSVDENIPAVAAGGDAAAAGKRKRIRKRGPRDAPEAPEDAPTTVDVNKPLIPASAAPKKQIMTVVDPAAAEKELAQQAKRARPSGDKPGHSAPAAPLAAPGTAAATADEVAALKAQLDQMTKLIGKLRSGRAAGGIVPDAQAQKQIKKASMQQSKKQKTKAPNATPINMRTLLGAGDSPLLHPKATETPETTLCVLNFTFSEDYYSLARWLLAQLPGIPACAAYAATDAATAAVAAAQTATAEGEAADAAALAAAKAAGQGLKRRQLFERRLTKLRRVKRELVAAGVSQLRLVETDKHTFKGFCFVTFATAEMRNSALETFQQNAKTLNTRLSVTPTAAETAEDAAAAAEAHAAETAAADTVAAEAAAEADAAAGGSDSDDDDDDEASAKAVAARAAAAAAAVRSGAGKDRSAGHRRACRIARPLALLLAGDRLVKWQPMNPPKRPQSADGQQQQKKKQDLRRNKPGSERSKHQQAKEGGDEAKKVAAEGKGQEKPQQQQQQQQQQKQQQKQQTPAKVAAPQATKTGGAQAETPARTKRVAPPTFA
jgi:hypothetical protein